MKVCCRFAPMVPQGTTDTHAGVSSIHRVPGVPLVLRVRGREGVAPKAESLEEVLVIDPVTHSQISFACENVFVASSLEQTVVYKGDAVVRRRQEDARRFSGDQETLYERSFAHVARESQPSALRRHLFLTYGQTSSGKTFTLFGPPGALSLAGRPSPTAGVVPRFFYDVFHTPRGGEDDAVWVEMTCMEIYNEATTDLVALALDKLRAARQVVPSSRRRASQSDPLESSLTGSRAAMASDVPSPVEDAFACYARAQNQGGALSCPPLAADGLPVFLQVVYKVTEKSKLWRSCLRLRCASAEACCAVTEQLLHLRQSSLTERNAHSSRGHLLLRAEVYTATPSAASWCAENTHSEAVLDREVLFVDLAGSESQRDVGDAASLAATHTRTATRANANTSTTYQRSHSGGSTRSLGVASNGSFSAAFGSPDSFTLNSTTTSVSGVHQPMRRRRRSASLTAAVMRNPAVESMLIGAATQKRSQEMRHINTSLLAFRKVIHAFHEASKQRQPPATLHAPFKDSTLTTVLEPYLIPTVASGTARLPDVIFLVCCSSQQRDFHETVSSLRLGAEASSVKAQVVLNALPVCRRQSPGPQGSSSHASVCAEGATDGVAAGGVRRGFTRSQSAPLYPAAENTGLSACENNARGSTQLLGGRGGRGSAGQSSAPPAMSPRPPQGPTHGGFVTPALTDEERGELMRLRQDVQSYKATALDLYEQCRQLCDNYARSVKALAASQAAHAEKDATIAALQAKLDAAQKTVIMAPAFASPESVVEVDSEPCATAHAEPNVASTRAVSAPRAEGQRSAAAMAAYDVTPWGADNDIIISADTTCQKSPPVVVAAVADDVIAAQEDEAARRDREMCVTRTPAPDVNSRDASQPHDAFRAAVLHALLQRQPHRPVVEDEDERESPKQCRTRVLSPTNTNCVTDRPAKGTLGRCSATVAVAEADTATLSELPEYTMSSSAECVPSAPPLHFFRS